MYCMKCGKRLPDNSRYCFNCGILLPIQGDNQPIVDQVIGETKQVDVNNNSHFDSELKDVIENYIKIIGNAGIQNINKDDLDDALVADLLVYLIVLSTTEGKDAQLLSKMIKYYFDINMSTDDISIFIGKYNLSSDMYLKSIPNSVKSIVTIDDVVHDYGTSIKSNCCELLPIIYKKIGEAYISGCRKQNAEQFIHSYIDMLQKYINGELKIIKKIEGMSQSNTDTSDNIMRLSGIEFENLCFVLLNKIGFEVKTTKASGDGGIDLIAWNNEPLKKGKYIIQCKRYTGTVGEPVIRDLYGVVMSERANKGVLITTGSFTTSALRFAENKQIELIDGNSLRYLLNTYQVRIDHGVNDSQGLNTILNNWFEYDALEELFLNKSASLPHYCYYYERLYDLFVLSCTQQYGVNVDDNDRLILLSKAYNAIERYKNLKIKNDCRYDATIVAYSISEAVIALYKGDIYSALERTLKFLSADQITKQLNDRYFSGYYICRAIMNVICLFNILGLYDKTDDIYNKYRDHIRKMIVVNNDQQEETFKENPREYMTFIIPCFNYSLVNACMDSKPSIDNCEYNTCTNEHELTDSWGNKTKENDFFPNSIEWKTLFSKVTCWNDNVGFAGFTVLKKSYLMKQRAKAKLLII